MVPETSPTATESPRPKGTLFCPGCGREGRADGDWELRRASSGTVYRCPDCGTHLTVRPREPDGIAAWVTRTPSPRSRTIDGALARSTRASIDLALTTMSFGTLSKQRCHR